MKKKHKTNSEVPASATMLHIDEFKEKLRVRRLARIMKCFKVNSCVYKEHSLECDKCVFYRKNK